MMPEKIGEDLSFGSRENKSVPFKLFSKGLPPKTLYGAFFSMYSLIFIAVAGFSILTWFGYI